MNVTRFDTLSRSLGGATTRRVWLAVLVAGPRGLRERTTLDAMLRPHDHGEGKNKKTRQPVAAPPPANPGAGAPPPLPPPSCTPSCTGGRSCQHGACACPPGRRSCGFRDLWGECWLTPDGGHGAFPCPGGQIGLPPADGPRVCGCASGTAWCGSQCLAPCAGARHPQTGGGCRHPGSVCGGLADEPCGTGTCDSGTCGSRPSGTSGTYDGECFPPTQCRNGACRFPMYASRDTVASDVARGPERRR